MISIFPYRSFVAGSASGSRGERKWPRRFSRPAVVASLTRFEYQTVRSRIGSPMIGRSPRGSGTTLVGGGTGAIDVAGGDNRPAIASPRPARASATRNTATHEVRKRTFGTASRAWKAGRGAPRSESTLVLEWAVDQAVR